MKRLICMVLVVVALATCLVGCGSFTCDVCQKEKSGEKHEETVLGETITYCEDCYNELEGAMDELADIF